MSEQTVAINEDFWKRLDKVLDARFAAFETKLDGRLTKIENNVKSLVKWTQRQDHSLEREMTESIKAYLEEHKRGFITIQPRKFPSSIVDNSGNEITEFDGVFILTNHPPYENIVKEGSLTVIPDEAILYFVIVEAKQHVTKAKVDKKFAQKKKLEEFIKGLHEGTMYYPPALKKFALHQFEPKVGLYVGGLDIEEAAREQLMKFATDDDMCGIIDLNGARFSVKNKTNDFGKSQFGGKKNRLMPKRVLL